MSELSVAQAIAWACQAQGIDRLDSQLLMGHVLGRPRAWLIAHDTDPLPPLAQAQYEALTARRAQGEPLAYLVGHQEFYGLSLVVGPQVLVPRADTETLVAWALDILAEYRPESPPPRVLDLGTGSGAIALAIKHQCPRAQVTAVDASAEALAVAHANARALGLAISFEQGHWLAPVSGRVFDLIVSNPPYIAENDPHMPALRFEPLQALTAGPDGLDDIRHIAAQAQAHLRPGGWLLLEHGYDQPQAVTDYLHAQQFMNVSTRFDLAGHGRCTGGQTSKG